MAYSFSQIQVFKKCPRKYQYQYIDKIEKEFEASADTVLGNSVHEALERLYDQINIFKIPAKQEVLDCFFDTRNAKLAEAEKDKPLQLK